MEIYTHMHTHHILFVHSSFDGHLGCFHFLALGGHVFTSLQFIARRGITGSDGNLLENF